MEIFHWEEDTQLRTYCPSEALLYAMEHDHRAYARYLLNQFPDSALARPGEYFCCSSSTAPHLAMAVRYDRMDIMALILQVAHRMPTLRSYMNRGGCGQMEDCKTPLHLACELSRSDAVMMLLGNGASPQAEDHKGMTPLDLILEQLWTSKVNTGARKLCLENLLMFMPEVRFKMKSSLEKDPQCWSKILGEEQFNYLVGRIPGRLFLIAKNPVSAATRRISKKSGQTTHSGFSETPNSALSAVLTVAGQSH